MTLPTAPLPQSVQLEDRAVRLVTQTLKKALELAAQQIMALYVKLSGGVGQPIPDHLRRAFADGAARIIAQVTFTDRDQLWRLVKQALAVGARDTGAATATAGAAAARPEVEDWIANLVGSIENRALAILASAKAAPQIGAPPAGQKDVVALIANAHRTLTTIERDIRWAMNAARQQGITETTTAAGWPRVWVAERDACLHCLAYSGQVAQAGQPYPTGLTYYLNPRGVFKPVTMRVVWGPPLHPNCRCDQQPYLGSDGYPIMPWETDETSVADALQREARRSVVRGRSGSDSVPARLRAASALLARGAQLPKSVEARARAAVKAGRFPSVPVG